MVYEVKCSECDKIIDFGGRSPEESLDATKTFPEDAYRFNGEVYCRECVEKFVKFGIGEIDDRVEYLEERMEKVLEALGLSKAKEGEGAQ